MDPGEAFAIRFETDVLIESISLKAGKQGSCGGSLRMGNRSALAIYCTDADNDAKDQEGIVSDLGILKKGEMLILDPSPHWGVETPGNWNHSQFAHSENLNEEINHNLTFGFPQRKSQRQAKCPFYCSR